MDFVNKFNFHFVIKRGIASLFFAVCAAFLMASATFAEQAPEEPAPQPAPYRYEFYLDGYASGSAYLKLDTTNGLDLLANGTTLKNTNGSTYNTKVQQVQLYQVTAKGYYNITTATNIVWVVSANPNLSTEIDATAATYTGESNDSWKKGKYQQTAAEKSNAVKAAKGKITAGKANGTWYVYAYRQVKISNTDNTLYQLGSFKASVSPAVTGVSLFKNYTGGSYTSGFTAADVSIGEALAVYVKAVGGNDDSTYTVALSSASDHIYLGFSKTAEGTPSSRITLTQGDFDTPFYVIPKSVNMGQKVTIAETTFSPKAAAVKITVTNDNTGKSVTATITIKNPVTGADGTKLAASAVSSEASASGVSVGTVKTGGTFDERTLPYIYFDNVADSVKSKEAVIDLSTSGMIKTSYEYKIDSELIYNGTDTPVIMVMNEYPDFLAITSAKNSVYSFAVQESAKKSTAVSASFSGGKLTITAKAAQTKATAYVVVAFNADKGDMTSVLVVPVVVNGYESDSFKSASYQIGDGDEVKLATTSDSDKITVQLDAIDTTDAESTMKFTPKFTLFGSEYSLKYEFTPSNPELDDEDYTMTTAGVITVKKDSVLCGTLTVRAYKGSGDDAVYGSLSYEIVFGSKPNLAVPVIELESALDRNGLSSASVDFTSTMRGTYYYLAVTSADTKNYTAEEIKAAIDVVGNNAGSGKIKKSAVGDEGKVTFSVSSLIQTQEYKLHLVAENAEGEFSSVKRATISKPAEGLEITGISIVDKISEYTEENPELEEGTDYSIDVDTAGTEEDPYVVELLTGSISRFKGISFELSKLATMSTCTTSDDKSSNGNISRSSFTTGTATLNLSFTKKNDSYKDGAFIVLKSTVKSQVGTTETYYIKVVLKETL